MCDGGSVARGVPAGVLDNPCSTALYLSFQWLTTVVDSSAPESGYNSRSNCLHWLVPERVRFRFGVDYHTKQQQTVDSYHLSTQKRKTKQEKIGSKLGQFFLSFN